MRWPTFREDTTSRTILHAVSAPLTRRQTILFFLINCVGVIRHQILQKLHTALFIGGNPPKDRFLIGISWTYKLWDEFRYRWPTTSFATNNLEYQLVELFVVSFFMAILDYRIHKQRAQAVVVLRILSPFITRSHAYLESPFIYSHLFNNFVSQSRASRMHIIFTCWRGI